MFSKDSSNIKDKEQTMKVVNNNFWQQLMIQISTNVLVSLTLLKLKDLKGLSSEQLKESHLCLIKNLWIRMMEKFSEKEKPCI